MKILDKDGLTYYTGKVKSALTDYVKFTDYAKNNKAGVITTSTYYGTVTDAAGGLFAGTFTYSQYLNRIDTCFISKGTLEGVIAGKGLINNQVNDLANYYTKTEIDNTIGDIGTALDLLNGEVI